MLDEIVTAVNVGSCLVICWVALSFFFIRGEPHDLWGLAIQLGLVLLIASSFVTPLALEQSGDSPSWWALTQRIGGAVVAACVYNWRFSVKRQFTHLAACFVDMAARTRAGLDLLRGLRKGRKT